MRANTWNISQERKTEHTADNHHNSVNPLALHRMSGLPIDTVRWDLCNLPIRSSSVDIIITDMPFGKRYRNYHNSSVH